MKKVISILIAVCLSVLSTVCFVGCDKDKVFVDTSNAVSLNAFDDPEFAKEQEAKDDAAGREHIEIPDGAETVIIDGEEYIPIDNLNDISTRDYDKNYILKNDIDSTLMGSIGIYELLTKVPFTGKFNGNNYKIYGNRESHIFKYIKGAEISNIVLSSELHYSRELHSIFCYVAEDSTIKNIANYSYIGDSRGTSYTLLGGMIFYLYNSTVENVINYGDVKSNAAIVTCAHGSVIRNCKNYGNVSSCSPYSITGAIVSEILYYKYHDTNKEIAPTVVEDCENYGNIIGINYIGGIVGRVELFYDAHSRYGTYGPQYFTDLSQVDLLTNQSVIRNCNNYGDIYRNRDYEESPFINDTVICCLGGIAGMGYKVENCTNSGNIYGFEVINPEYTVDYIGGVAGAACTIDNCTSTTKLTAASTIEHTDDICGYLMER